MSDQRQRLRFHRSKLLGPIWLLLLSACVSDVAPITRVIGTLHLEEPPVLFVTANRDRERVIASLAFAGIRVTESARESDLVLNVKLGAKKSDSACGVVRNAIYVLRENAEPIFQIKGRGGTGECANNILNLMSLELARLLEVRTPDRIAD